MAAGLGSGLFHTLSRHDDSNIAQLLYTRWERRGAVGFRVGPGWYLEALQERESDHEIKDVLKAILVAREGESGD